jgi:CRP-like cAMP-binding protein
MRMQHYHDALFEYISLIIDIPEHDRDQCRNTFKPLWVAKDTMLEVAGKVPLYHNFIVSGFMRKFYVNDKGEEVTVDLNNGPRFFTSYYDFMRQTVSNEYLQCITDCELLRITRPDAESTAKTSITQKDYTIRLFQQIQEEDRERMDDLATLTAEQRYVKLMKNSPNIIQNVPLKYIASYLGIKPESLSRIRREIIS